MRVYHIASEYPPIQVFGLGRAVHGLAVAQAELGTEVHVVTNSIGGRDPDALVDGVWVHRIAYPPPPKPPDDTAAVTQFNISALEKAVGAAAEHGEPDVIHAHDWLTVLSSVMLRKLYPVARLAATIHDTSTGKNFGHLQRPQQYSAHLERWVGAQADTVICCSQHVRAEMESGYGCASDRLHVIPCGVDERRFDVQGDLDTFRGLFADPEDRLVLYVGRLDPEKGVEVLIDAMAQVVAIEPRAKLLIVGKGQLQDALQQRMRGLNIGERAQFAGYLGDAPLAALMRAAAAMVIPSLYEPFGLVALEGMACGTPVIASDTGGLSEVIDDGTTGLLTPPGDVRSLARAILTMLSDTALAQRLARAGRDAAIARYRWCDVARQTLEAYRTSAEATAATGG